MNLEQISPSIDIKTLDEDELLLTHTTLHSFWRELKDMERQVGEWGENEIVTKHNEVVQELERNGLPHQELNDLDEEQPEVESLDASTEWAENVVESDNPEDYIQSNPPEADWYLEAIERVEQIDGTIDVREHVTLSTTKPSELGRGHAHEFFKQAGVEEMVGYTYTPETEEGVILAKDNNRFVVQTNHGTVYESEMPDEAYPVYLDLSEEVEQENSVLEAAIEHEEIEQGEFVDAQENYQWYVWSQEEAEEWLEMHEFSTDSPEQRDGMLIYEQTEQEVYDVMMEWRGPARRMNVLDPRLDGRPYMVKFGFPNQERQDPEHPVVKSIAFRVEMPVGGEDINQPVTPQDIPSDLDSGVHGDEEEERQSSDTAASIEQAFGVDVASADLAANESDQDWYWYEWNGVEIDQWTSAQEISDGDVSVEDGFVEYEVRDPEPYEQLNKTWKGARQKKDELAGGEKPRRVTYGITEDGEKEIQKIEFRVGE